MPAYFVFAALVLTILLSLIALVWNLRRQKRILSTNKRLCLTLSNAYEQIYEMDLTHNEFYQYFILNNLFEKASMHEPLNIYLPRIIREHVFYKDIQKIQRLLNLEELQRLSDKNGSLHTEYRRLSPDGTPYWCSMLVQCLRKSGRDPSVAMLYITDIDASKRKEEEARTRLMEALRNAERLSEVKSNFTGQISHEIRTPLNAIMGYMSIAHRYADEPERVMDCMVKAEVASNHLLALVNDILDVSALESGKMRLDEQPFKLRDFLGNLSFLYYGQAKEAGLEFNVRLEGITEETLVGDDMRLRQILMNLLNNALKFTPRGGHVELTVEQHTVVNDIAHLTFSVRDDGIGMREEFLAHIFDAFEQEESGTARRYGGSGLGVHIVKSLVDMMGGVIEIQTEYGKGSEFMVSLPMRRVSCQWPHGAQRIAISKLRVLVAADDRSTLKLISSFMNRLEVRHDTAISGDVAVEKAEQAIRMGEGYNLFLLDWDINGMNSAEGCKRVRAALGEALYIAAIVGREAPALQSHAKEWGVETVIQKPLNQDVLMELLCDVANGRDGSPAETTSAQTLDFGGKRVLLVEDNRLNREIGRELLHNVNLTVEMAENGQECLDAFLSAPEGAYQLILMDIQMPVMDGFTATKRIRASERADAQTIPIIALTANAYPSDVNQSLSAGMNAHASKPIDPDALYALLSRFIVQ